MLCILHLHSPLRERADFLALAARPRRHLFSTVCKVSGISNWPSHRWWPIKSILINWQNRFGSIRLWKSIALWVTRSLLAEPQTGQEWFCRWSWMNAQSYDNQCSPKKFWRNLRYLIAKPDRLHTRPSWLPSTSALKLYFTHFCV